MTLEEWQELYQDREKRYDVNVDDLIQMMDNWKADREKLQAALSSTNTLLVEARESLKESNRWKEQYKEELWKVREAKFMIYAEKQDLQRIYDNFVEAFDAKLTR